MERRLVEQARRGDEEAFAELAHAVGPRLFGIARRILGDFHRAEDVTQQALVQIWRKLPELGDPDRFDGWAYRIVVNGCYAESRRARHEPAVLSIADGDAADRSSSTIDDREMLERAFVRLSVDQRVVLVLMYYRGLEQPEIARTLGIPQGTVKSRAASGRQALRAALEADARSELDLEVAT